MRNFIISFIALCLYGCSPTILGHKITFAKHEEGAFCGECGEKIDQKIIYKFKDGVIRKIFYEDKEEFAYYDEIVIPIQSCEGEWCKIYYPCGQKEYFVKKDDIVKESTSRRAKELSADFKISIRAEYSSEHSVNLKRLEKANKTRRIQK